MLRIRLSEVFVLSGACLSLAGGAIADERLPVFDVHLHALPADAQGPPPLAMCTPMTMPTWDPAEPYTDAFIGMMKTPDCEDPVWSPTEDSEVRDRSIAAMERRNVVGILSGTTDRVAEWRAAAPGRFYPGLGFNLATSDVQPDELRALYEDGKLYALAEITNQYAGIALDDPRMDPYWRLAEELDIPVGVHVGPGPPGVIYLGSAEYRAALHSPIALEDVLVRYPGLRVYVMHAGFPMLDDMLAVLYAHPQVHVGIGVIVYTQRREAFYRYLKGIVDAGFGKRVLFGSDQMVWPETIERSIDVIEAAPFLSAEEKRDILYNNAARFFRLSEETVARHHDM